MLMSTPSAVASASPSQGDFGVDMLSICPRAQQTSPGPCMQAGHSAHQRRVLYIVPQQSRVIERVLGFLLHGVHWAFLYLVLDGLEEFVQGLPSTVLERGHNLRHRTEVAVGTTEWVHCWPLLPQSPAEGPTLRYWYRQTDIQLDSIRSTTVSDLGAQRSQHV